MASTNAETWLGFGLGMATAAYLWLRSGSSSASPSSKPHYTRQLRDFQKSDLTVYDGKDGRLSYIALPEPEDGVFDVSSSSEEFAEVAGTELSSSSAFDVDQIKAKYAQVGKLIRPREITVDELFEMDGRLDKPIWLSCKGEVFDVSKNGGRDFYGPDSGYACMAGRDASRALALVSLERSCVDNNRIDDLTASDMMTLEEWRMKFHSKYTCIGTLANWTTAGSPPPTKLASSLLQQQQTEVAPFLTRERQSVKLSEKIVLSPDTFLFRFALPNKQQRLGLPIGKHIKFWCKNLTPKVPGEWNGKPDPEFDKPEIERKYTPSTLDSEALGHFDVVIKVYSPNERFVDGGKMSRFFGNLQVGESVDVAGPFGLIEYKGQGVFTISKREVKASFIGLMAGGTGITPMLQLIKAILLNPADSTKISLLFANQTVEDILLKDMLEALQSKYPDQFKLHFTLDRAPQDWKFSTGFINEEMIQSHMPPSGPETMIFACGPPPMVKFACKQNLEKMGYDVANRFAEF